MRLRNPLEFLTSASDGERRALLASGLGWMLDGMDVTLYAMVISELLRALRLTTGQAGLLASVTLVGSAFWISEIAFLIASLLALGVPETRGLRLS